MIILITGIPRSGSTFLYNVMRVFCIRRYGLQNVDFGYLDSRRKYRPGVTYVLKTHDFLPERKWSDQEVFILHSTRNHDDSHARFLDFVRGLHDDCDGSEGACATCPEQYSLDKIQEMDRQWQEVCSLCVEYDDIRNNSVAVVWKVLTALNACVSFDECESIVREVEALPDPPLMNCLTLLYPRHKKTDFSLSA